MVLSVYEKLRLQPGALDGTLAHASRLSRLNSRLHQRLGPPLAAHCELANIRFETAVLRADSPVWAAKLRYQTPAILDILNSGELLADLTPARLTRLRLRIGPVYEPQRRDPLPTLRLSSSAARLLEKVAEATEDLRLKLALSRLARRSRHRC